MLSIFDQKDLKTEEIAKHISKNFVKLRKRHKISQQKLAELTGVSYGSIKRFESKGLISFVSLIKIAQFFNNEQIIEELFHL